MESKQQPFKSSVQIRLDGRTKKHVGRHSLKVGRAENYAWFLMPQKIFRLLVSLPLQGKELRMHWEMEQHGLL
jgi:hypothetical protein